MQPDFSVLALIVVRLLTLIGMVIDFTIKPHNQIVAGASNLTRLLSQALPPWRILQTRQVVAPPTPPA